MRYAAIHRIFLPLWIALRMAAVIQPRGMIFNLCQGNLSRNMQKRKEPLSKPLLLVVIPDECGCLNNRQFDKYTRHLPVLMTNPATCSHGYPQKMGKESGTHVISRTRDCSRGSCTSTVQLQHTIFSGNLVSGERWQDDTRGITLYA